MLQMMMMMVVIRMRMVIVISKIRSAIAGKIGTATADVVYEFAVPFTNTSDRESGGCSRRLGRQKAQLHHITILEHSR